MVTSPGIGHSGPQRRPPRRGPLALASATSAAILLVGCVRGTYLLTEFEANCGDEPDADKPCLKSTDPAFTAYPLFAAVLAAILCLVLLSIPVRYVILRRLIAALAVAGPLLSALKACDTASGYGFVP
jgi:hypothetical protein